MEFFRGYSIFYDQANMDYRNKDKMDELLLDFAMSLGYESGKCTFFLFILCHSLNQSKMLTYEPKMVLKHWFVCVHFCFFGYCQILCNVLFCLANIVFVKDYVPKILTKHYTLCGKYLNLPPSCSAVYSCFCNMFLFCFIPCL